MNRKERQKHKAEFRKALAEFTTSLREHVSTESGDWTVKGFIDVYRNIYTISSDTKIVSKILEIHIFPQLLQFAESIGYSIVLAEKQNWYPDLSLVKHDDPEVKFAVDLKTTYRDPKFPGHINGFTLGSHGKYFTDRASLKNIQFPYGEYLGHFCLGIIYSRADVAGVSETEVFKVAEIQEEYGLPDPKVGEREVTTVENLRSITSVVGDFDFFVAEKWQIASDQQGSANTANIGSITNIDDLKAGRGIFSDLGEDWFDEYWMNYGSATMMREGKSVRITRLRDFLEFKGRTDLLEKIAARTPKRRG